MHKVLLSLVATAGIMTAVPAASTTTSTDYKATTKHIDEAYKSEKDRCGPLKGNTKDVCIAEAKARQKIAKAEARAEHEGTLKARTNARLARADADYSVAKEKCDDLAGNGKDVCLKEAKAAHVSATADAKTDRKVNETRRDAAEEKRDAEYKVAIERCDAFSGEAKSRCVSDAKARFGKS